MALFTGQWATSQKRRHEEKDPQLGVPQSTVLYCNWMMCARQWSMLKSQRSLLNSWITRIAKQHMFGCLNGNLSMTLKNAQGKDGAVAACAEHWKSIKMSNLLWKFQAYDVYNATEISLFHHTMPDGALGYKHATQLGPKKAMDCANVLRCSNMSRTDKMKLLVIGKNAKPECFNKPTMDSYVLCSQECVNDF